MTKNGACQSGLFRSVLIGALLVSLAGPGCVVVHKGKHDQGLHKGHYKDNKK